MFDDFRVPIGGFIVAESGVEYPTFAGFLAPGSGIFAVQIERYIGRFWFTRLPFYFRWGCFNLTVVIVGVLPC